MTEADLRHHEKRLREMLAGLEERKRQFLDRVSSPVGNATANDIASASVHPESVGISDGDEEVALGLYRSSEATFEEVVAALQRLEEGTFGICDHCGKKIPQGRLTVVPYAPRCVRCSGE